MIIHSLGIRKGMEAKSFRFSDRFTLICSNDKNGVGKTTLVRFLLYALGENVSGTQGCRRLESFETKLVMTNDSDEKLKLVRSGLFLKVISAGNVERYSLPLDLQDAKKRIYGISNNDVITNLLGAFYIDQDRGWTLLNRGKVICDIHFNIEEFLRGLAGTDSSKLTNELQRLSKELDKYKFIRDASGYQSALVDEPGFQELSRNLGRDRERLTQLRIQNASYKKRIAFLKRAQKDNERFVGMVDKMGLMVQLSDGSAVRVTSSNLVGYDDSEKCIDNEILALRVQQEKILEQMKELETSLSADEQLVQVDSLAVSFDKQFAGLDFDTSNLDGIVESLQKQKAEISKELKDELQDGRPCFDMLSNTILNYCDKLGVKDVYLKDGRGILTNDLKSKSGTFYHLLVFAFRMAYATAVKEYEKVTLPLIIDSIRGRELSDENVEKCISFLMSDMQEHQRIVVSISDEGIGPDATIEISDSMMEGACHVDDIEAWELEE